MKLQGEKIANMTKFREHFVLKEVVRGLHQFLRDFSPEKVFYEEEKDERLYHFIKASCRRPEQGKENIFSIGYREEGENRNIVLWGKEEAKEPVSIELEYQDQGELEMLMLSDAQKHQPRQTAGMTALCELAHCRIGEAERVFILEQAAAGDGPDSGAGSQRTKAVGRVAADGIYETDQGIIFTAQATGYRLRRWCPSPDDASVRITTKRLFRQSYSKYAGGVDITVEDEAGKEIPSAKRTMERELYANFIGDKLVEFLPAESIIGPYRIYKDWEANGRGFLRRDRENKLQITYPDANGELGRMSCFAAAKDGGFVGISGGKLLGYTSEVKLPSLSGEAAVSICLKNGLYVILTESGHTKANFNFFFQNVCMIRMDKRGNAYGLLSNGRMVTSHPDKKALLESLEDVVSIEYREDTENLILYRKGQEPVYIKI